MGDVTDIRNGKPIDPKNTRRSEFGLLLSRILPGFLPPELGDFGIRYDRLSRIQRVGMLVGSVVIAASVAVGLVGVAKGVAEGVAEAFGANLPEKQRTMLVDGNAHSVVSFMNHSPQRNIWGYPNTDGENATFGKIAEGATVTCAPVINGMAFVQNNGVNGFVSFGPKDVIPNPESCPDKALVQFSQADSKYPYFLTTKDGTVVNIPMGHVKIP